MAEESKNVFDTNGSDISDDANKEHSMERNCNSDAPTNFIGAKCDFEIDIAGTEGCVLEGAVQEYLRTLDLNDLPPYNEIEKGALKNIKNYFIIACSMMDKKDKWRIPRRLSHSAIASIIQYVKNVKSIACAGTDANEKFDMLAMYQTSGKNEGIYVDAENEIRYIAKKLDYQISSREMDEVINQLRVIASEQRMERCEDPDLIAVNNGIFNYKTKQLMPFTPEFVFMSKSRVNYNPNAQNINIHNDKDNTDWNIEGWMNSISNDSEIVELLWELLGAIIRPYVSWSKSAWLYSAAGNNGKGTLCDLMRNLCGNESHTAIEIADFGREFALENLINKLAIITDENDVSMFIDKVAKLKAVITGDIVPISRKFKTTLAYRYKGFMVQCVNGIPKVKDKTGSLYRRLLVIPFTKCFTGSERKYIKDEYIKNPDVLEYVLYRVLHTDYYELSEPEACRAALNEYKIDNDPVRQFWVEFHEQFVWDLLPFSFLYGLYKEWFAQNNPSGKPLSNTSFINDLCNIIQEQGNGDWYCFEDRRKEVRPKNMMREAELLIFQYNLISWKNPSYHGADPKIISHPTLKPKYRGILRNGVSADTDDN